MGEKRVTIKDISNRLGVSYGIINRALNGKPGVSDKTREKILTAAAEMGYRANKVAKSLARAPITIAVLIPDEWQSYYSVLEKGVTEELDRLWDYNVRGSFYRIKNSFSSSDTVEALKNCIRDKVDGIVLCDVFPCGLEEIFDEIKERNIPIVTIGGYESIADKCLSSIRVDAYKSGLMAAEILSSARRKNDSAVILVGNKDSTEHKEKIRGFADGAKKYGLNFTGAYETQDNDEIATRIFGIMIKGGNLPGGIYLATSASGTILEMAKNEKAECNVVATDVNDDVVRGLRERRILCSLFQNPEKQGRLAVRAVYEYLSERKLPESAAICVSPLPVINSNLGDFISAKENPTS